MGRQSVDHRRQAAHGGVEPRRQEGAHQALALLLGDLASVRRREHRRSHAAGAEPFALAIGRHPGQGALRPAGRFLQQMIGRAIGVEHHVAIGQQVFAAFLRQPDRVAKGLERKHLGQIARRVEPAARRQGVDHLVGQGAPLRPQGVHGRRPQQGIDHHPRLVMRRRIGFQQQAGGAPGRGLGEVDQAYAAAGTEGLPVMQAGNHLGMAGHGIDAVAGQPHHRPRLAHGVVAGKRIGQEGVAERIQVQNRNVRR